MRSVVTTTLALAYHKVFSHPLLSRFVQHLHLGSTDTSSLNCMDEANAMYSAMCRRYSNYHEGSRIKPRKRKEHLATFQSKTVGYSTRLKICDTDELLLLHPLTMSVAFPLQLRPSQYCVATKSC